MTSLKFLEARRAGIFVATHHKKSKAPFRSGISNRVRRASPRAGSSAASPHRIYRPAGAVCLAQRMGEGGSAARNRVRVSVLWFYK